MQEHLLIRLAKRKPYHQTPEMPEGSFFNNTRGLWIKNNNPLIQHSSEFGVQATKKCDLETGEDQKGE
ncbi:hypothetical protein [Deefgea salmonis]|uniref:Uncharacterized protein n=1 Tax=Deefgea salmonis TaxID=2875502 RepID=A0ABS8BMH5_9NEIS|nr:hypothetical protein [Deefgea salmonis]MCB5196918.1 hypothetical protein [Deefgea salmonis]